MQYEYLGCGVSEGCVCARERKEWDKVFASKRNDKEGGEGSAGGNIGNTKKEDREYQSKMTRREEKLWE